MPEFLTYAQVVELLSLPSEKKKGLNLIQKWVSRGEIPFVRIGGRTVRFERAAIEKWIESRRNLKASPRKAAGK